MWLLLFIKYNATNIHSFLNNSGEKKKAVAISFIMAVPSLPGSVAMAKPLIVAFATSPTQLAVTAAVGWFIPYTEALLSLGCHSRLRPNDIDTCSW